MKCKQLDFQEEKTKCLQMAQLAPTPVVYDKSWFIGGNHEEEGVECYDCGIMVFVRKASTQEFNPETRYDDFESTIGSKRDIKGNLRSMRINRR
jgi:hypothetical protein